ncbi:hypothetical protein ACFGXD_09030 [Pasteurella multocida]|uniref:hypothetical protein n=1 Tax=Pasteurella multocida TaxID=747 RepID=UPI002931DAB1|nr:hypothetical protein [Pasteurella multocida]HEH9616926.1 hypothetical protein [Pasteurella multocida]HEH9663177.1 hypothetical protein [Pasteurella multocida]HEH9676815.1 hypothetical protein [Pasteurella multocida]HEH9690159.1 hypothetical protein [Pasteurella multocida]HEH9699373.1 hypothetical protein [Pasteurella multocida]
MENKITKEECKAQLEELGVRYEELGMTLKEHLGNATTEINNKTYHVNLYQRSSGIEIKADGNNKACLVTYEAMINMAEAMGLFDETQEKNNG